MATSSNSAADWSLGVRSKIALRVFASHLAGVRCCPLVRRSCWPASRSPEPVLSDPPRPRCCYLVQAVGLVLLGARQGAVEGQGLPVGGQGLLMTTQIIQGATDIDQAAGLLTLSAGQSAAKTQGPREGGGCLLQAPGFEQPDTLVEGLLGTPEELVTGVPLPVCHDSPIRCGQEYSSTSGAALGVPQRAGFPPEPTVETRARPRSTDIDNDLARPVPGLNHGVGLRNLGQGESRPDNGGQLPALDQVR